MKLVRLGVLAAAVALASSTGTVVAADLGGNCCADLEERIAELEATTARKGNRKVSLAISGWVAQNVIFWDDGVERNVYVADAGNALASHFKLAGSAAINQNWSAGYVLHIETISNEPLFNNQDVDSGNRSVSVYNSYWFVKNDRLGTVSVGLQSSAADNQAVLPDGSGTLMAANYVLYDTNGFFLRASSNRGFTTLGVPGVNQTWGQLATCPQVQLGVAADCDVAPTNNVKWDSPTIAGFSASASWGEDDTWAVSARYAGEINGFKLSLGTAYTESTDSSFGLLPFVNAAGQQVRGNGGAFQIGAYAQHVQTGLFVYGAYGRDYNFAVSQFFDKPDGDNWYIKSGIRKQWNTLGHTVLFGEVGEDSDKQSIALWNAGITSSDLRQWGLGVQQEIDGAAMAIWAVYRNYSADVTCEAVNNNAGGVGGCGAPGNIDLEDISIFKIGAVIAF